MYNIINKLYGKDMVINDTNTQIKNTNDSLNISFFLKIPDENKAIL